MEKEETRLLTPKQAAQYLSIGVTTLKQNYRQMLPPKKVGPKSIRYDIKDLDAFIESLPRG